MAKKSRRAKKRVQQKRRMPVTRTEQPVSAPSVSVARETAATAKDITAQLAEEYRYVYSDLKRVAILAGSILALLIVLSFFIR